MISCVFHVIVHTMQVVKQYEQLIVHTQEITENFINPEHNILIMHEMGYLLLNLFRKWVLKIL